MRRFFPTFLITALFVQAALAQQAAQDTTERIHAMEKTIGKLRSVASGAAELPSAPAPQDGNNAATREDGASSLPVSSTTPGGSVAGPKAPASETSWQGTALKPEDAILSAENSPTTEDARRAMELRARLEALRARAAGEEVSENKAAEAEAEAEASEEGARRAAWRAEKLATLRAEIQAADLSFLENFVDREQDRRRGYVARKSRPVATLAPEVRLMTAIRPKSLYNSAHEASVAGAMDAGTVTLSLGVSNSNGVLRRLVWVPGRGAYFVADIDLETARE